MSRDFDIWEFREAEIYDEILSIPWSQSQKKFIWRAGGSDKLNVLIAYICT